MIVRLLSLLLLALPLTLLGADGDGDKPSSEAPPPPPMLEGNGNPELSEPEVTIRKDGDNVITEYRMHGQLYMIRITPSVGKPYYLVDADGDGKLEDQRFELDPGVMVPAWTIFRW